LRLLIGFEGARFPHLGEDLDYRRDQEGAPTQVLNGSRVLLLQIYPRLAYLEFNVVCFGHGPID
jgi:hypothetical protein